MMLIGLATSVQAAERPSWGWKMTMATAKPCAAQIVTGFGLTILRFSLKRHGTGSILASLSTSLRQDILECRELAKKV